MEKLAVTIDERTYEVELNPAPQNSSGFWVKVNGEMISVIVPDLERPVEEMEWIVVDGRPYELAFDPDLRWIKAYSGLYRVEIRDLKAPVVRPRSGDGRVKAPIPGLITRVMVELEQTVDAGQPLLVLEAMKMENEIRAPCAGVVSALHVTSGQGVSLRQVLAEITAR